MAWEGNRRGSNIEGVDNSRVSYYDGRIMPVVSSYFQLMGGQEGRDINLDDQ